MPDIFLDLASQSVVGGDFPVSRTSTANGTGVDLIDVAGNMQSALLLTGAVSGTSPTLDVKIQESADNSTWSDVPGATFTQQTAANQRQLISFAAIKRYVRAVYTLAGTSPNFATGVTFLGSRRHNPTNSGGFAIETGGSI